jgi:hypothetical protein
VPYVGMHIHNARNDAVLATFNTVINFVTQRWLWSTSFKAFKDFFILWPEAGTLVIVWSKIFDCSLLPAKDLCPVWSD